MISVSSLNSEAAPLTDVLNVSLLLFAVAAITIERLIFVVGVYCNQRAPSFDDALAV